jgi:hypothetical protein
MFCRDSLDTAIVVDVYHAAAQQLIHRLNIFMLFREIPRVLQGDDPALLRVGVILPIAASETGSSKSKATTTLINVLEARISSAYCILALGWTGYKRLALTTRHSV